MTQNDSADHGAGDSRAHLGIGNRVIRIFAWVAKAKLTHGSITIVRDPEGRVLLVRQRLRERNRWGLPGGFMSINERPLDCAVRELTEETGIVEEGHKFQPLAEYRQSWAWHYDHLFRVTANPQQVLSVKSKVEIKDAAWYRNDQLPALTRAAAEALTIERSINSQNNGGSHDHF